MLELDRTALNRSLAPQEFIEGMKLGIGVDAITGEITDSAIDSHSIKIVEETSGDTEDQFRVSMALNGHDLRESDEFKVSSSISFPVDGLDITAKQRFGFSQKETSSSHSLLIILRWVHHGPHKHVGDGAKLSEVAHKALDGGPGEFRGQFGDYYVHQIAYQADFSAVWKCTAENASSLIEFKNSFKLPAQVAGSIGGSGGLSATISESAKSLGIMVDVQYEAHGADHVKYDSDDVGSTFNNFLSTCKPIPRKVFLRHYQGIDGRIPPFINMSPKLYGSLCEVFSTARLVLVLNGLIPAKGSTRLRRREKIMQLFRNIHSRRSNFSKDPEALKAAIDELAQLRKRLLFLIDCHDLVADLRNQTFEERCRKFKIDAARKNGPWVMATPTMYEWYIGWRPGTPEEEKKYAVQTVREGPGMECHAISLVTSVTTLPEVFERQYGSLNFPGGTNCHGIPVGFVIRSMWRDGTGGWWCIPHDNPLGKKEFKIDVKSEKGRGMHWLLEVTYIPSSVFDDDDEN